MSLQEQMIAIDPFIAVHKESPERVRRRRFIAALETAALMVAVIVYMTSLNAFMNSVREGAERSWSATSTRRLYRAFRSWRWMALFFLPLALLVINRAQRWLLRQWHVLSASLLVPRVAGCAWILSQFAQLVYLMYRMKARDEAWCINAITYLTLAMAALTTVVLVESLHAFDAGLQILGQRRRSSATLPTKSVKAL